MKVYLAGPEVFLPDAVEIGKRKCELCHRYGLEGLYPLDKKIRPKHGETRSRSIFAGNIHMIREADVLVANLTPFRGVSADVGTVFELGFAFALDKPVAGYSNTGTDLQRRVLEFLKNEQTTAGPDETIFGVDDLAIENFKLNDNLMVIEALKACQHDIFLPGAPVADIWRDLGAFESCLKWLAAAGHEKRNIRMATGG